MWTGRVATRWWTRYWAQEISPQPRLRSPPGKPPWPGPTLPRPEQVTGQERPNRSKVCGAYCTFLIEITMIQLVRQESEAEATLPPGLCVNKASEDSLGPLGFADHCDDPVRTRRESWRASSGWPGGW